MAAKSRAQGTLGVFALVALVASSPAWADSILCPVPDSAQQAGPVQLIDPYFWAHRVGLPHQQLRHRDLEFLWDPINDSTLTPELELTLRNFALTLVDSLGKNPFGAPISDFNLIYSYFRNPAYGLPYSSNPADTFSVLFGTESQGYNPSDRSHVDVYMFHPSRFGVGGAYPAWVQGGEEDVSTGHDTSDVKHSNSLMVKSPTGAARFDLAGSGWTAPNSLLNVAFNHELRHGLPGRESGGMMGEMMSAGAEAIGGNGSIEKSADFPYTWSVYAFDTGASPTCTFLRTQATNYQGRSAFASYLAYNFRGRDTSATTAGLADDLLFKWNADTDPSVASLRGLLNDHDCGTCSTKVYFHPSQGTMSDTLRLALLHHNFRVANYVNNSFVEEGQYGYPPQFGFSPAKQLSAWQDIDGCLTDNVIAVPSEVTLGAAHVSRDTVLRDVRYSGPGNFPMVLNPNVL